MLGGAQSRSRHGFEQKNSQPPQGIETPIIQPVANAIPTEPSRLIGPPTYSDLKLTSETVNPFRHFGRMGDQSITQGFDLHSTAQHTTKTKQGHRSTSLAGF
jgi:hypothetical protein